MVNVSCFLDDILVTGATEEEHIETLKMVCDKLKKAGLTISLYKCDFLNEAMQYLGFRISTKVLMKSESKFAAIREATRPNNVREVRIFLGMVNYYGKFIPNAARMAKTLIYNFLKENVKFNWSKQCKNAFNQIKNIIISDLILVHFDPGLPLVVICNASRTEVTTVLSHRMKSGEERPICFASRTLTKAEKKYPTCHLEALAIFWATNK